MTNNDMKVSHDTLAEFGAVLARRRREWNSHGHLQTSTAETLSKLERNISQLRGRVEAAGRHNNVWALLKTELARDVRAIAEEFRNLIARADASETEWARTHR